MGLAYDNFYKTLKPLMSEIKRHSGKQTYRYNSSLDWKDTTSYRRADTEQSRESKIILNNTKDEIFEFIELEDSEL